MLTRNFTSFFPCFFLTFDAAQVDSEMGLRHLRSLGRSLGLGGCSFSLFPVCHPLRVHVFLILSISRVIAFCHPLGTPVPVIHHHLIHSRHLSAFTTKIQTQKTLTKKKNNKNKFLHSQVSTGGEELDRQLLQQQQQQKQQKHSESLLQQESYRYLKQHASSYLQLKRTRTRRGGGGGESRKTPSKKKKPTTTKQQGKIKNKSTNNPK
jgi:hypothetical protein